MAKILACVSLSFFRYDLSIVSISYRDPISKVVCGLHCFSSEIIGKFVVNEHYVFHGDKDSLSLLGKIVFFVHV